MSVAKVLIVDDSSSVRISVARILTKAGYEVITASDGVEAIERLKENPSMMILDVNMPVLDGYGVCEKIRELGSEFVQLPIVFLTGLESKALELLGREFGAYLRKPVEERELISTVQNQLVKLARTSPMDGATATY